MFYASLVVLVNEKREVLCLRRSDSMGSFKGMWGLPGGKAENTEMPEETAIRETKEETNLLIDEDELFFIHKMVKGEKDFYVFVTEYWYGDIELDHEHEEFEWVPIKELPDKLQIPTDGIIFYMLNSLYNIV